MTIHVKVHTILGIKRIIGQGEVDVSLPVGSTLKSLLIQMVEAHGKDLSTLLYGEGGTDLLPHIRVMVNGRDIGFLKGLSTELKDGDEILVLPPVSGG